MSGLQVVSTSTFADKGSVLQFTLPPLLMGIKLANADGKDEYVYEDESEDNLEDEGARVVMRARMIASDGYVSVGCRCGNDWVREGGVRVTRQTDWSREGDAWAKG